MAFREVLNGEGALSVRTKWNDNDKELFDLIENKILIQGRVDYFADLPAFADHSGEFWIVSMASGSVITFNRKAAGLYESDGTQWNYTGINMDYRLTDSNFIVADDVDATKRMRFEVSAVSAGNTRIITVADYDQNLAYPVFQTTTLDSDYNPTGSEVIGTTYWDADNHTTSTVLENGVIMQNGMELPRYGKNSSRVIIPNGRAVSMTNEPGQFTTWELTDFTSEESVNAFVGIATQDIGINDFGYVNTTGLVRDFDTSAWTEKATLYGKCTSTIGELTTDYPDAECYIVKIGIVEYSHAQHGRINVNSSVYPKLQDLSGVDGTPLTTNGQILVWSQDNNYHDFNYNINDYATLTYVDDSILAIPDSSEGTRGLIQIADALDAALGEDDSKAMTPLKTFESIRLNHPQYTENLADLDMGDFDVYASNLYASNSISENGTLLSSQYVKSDGTQATPVNLGGQDLDNVGSVDATSYLLNGTSINEGGLNNVAYLDQFNNYTNRNWFHSSFDYSFVPVEISNFRQTDGTMNEGMIVHNYTDMPAMQLDNVGSGSILTLKNARNPTNRPDQPNDYVGTGNFITFKEVDDVTFIAKDKLIIDNDASFIWTSDDVIDFRNTKVDDGLYGFRFYFDEGVENMVAFHNGTSTIAEFSNTVGNERFDIDVNSAMSYGSLYRVRSGDLTLRSDNGSIFNNIGGVNILEVNNNGAIVNGSITGAAANITGTATIGAGTAATHALQKQQIEALISTGTLNLTTVNTATYTTVSTDNQIHVTYTTTGACTVTIATTDISVEGRVLTITDGGGNATLNNITIATEGSQTINGETSWVIGSNYNSITLYSDGTNLFVK